MGAFEGLKRTEDQAYAELMDLYRRRQPGRRKRWDDAQEALEKTYTHLYAARGSYEAATRRYHLSVIEPTPIIEDFYQADMPPRSDGKNILRLELVHRLFDLMRSSFPARDQARRDDLDWSTDLMHLQLAAEAARIRPSSVPEETADPVLVAVIAETKQELAQLFSEKRRAWVLVGFTSVLMQGVRHLQPMADDRREQHRFTRRIADPCELERFIGEITTEVHRLQQCLNGFMASAPFMRLFNDAEHYTDPAPEHVVAAADALLAFYASNLGLARTIAHVDARPDMAPALDALALLVSDQVTAMNGFIEKLVGFTDIAADSNLRAWGCGHELTLELGRTDSDLTNLARAQLQKLPGRQPDSVFIANWNRRYDSHTKAEKWAEADSETWFRILGFVCSAVVVLWLLYSSLTGK